MLKFGKGNEAHTFHCCTQINQYFQGIFHNQHWWGFIMHNVQTWMHLAPVWDHWWLFWVFFFNIPFSAGNYWCDQSPIPFSSFSLPPPTFSHSLRSDHLEILLHLFIMCEFPPRAESVTVLKCDALTHWGRKQRGVGDYNTSWPTPQSLYDLIIFISLYPFLCIPAFPLYPLLKYSHNLKKKLILRKQVKCSTLSWDSDQLKKANISRRTGLAQAS